MRHLLFSLILIGLLSSCNLQKRKYLSGYYSNKPSVIKAKIPKTKDAFESIQKNEISFSSFTADSILELKNTDPLQFATTKETVCDTLFMSNGVKMIVKVSDVNKEKIHYYLCDSENQAEFYIETPKIKKICYANGLTDELKNPKDAPYDNYTPNQNQYNQGYGRKNYELEDAKRKANQSLGLVLGGCFFFPVMVAGFIMAHNAKKKLKNQRGYESSYQLANTLSIIGYVFLGIIAFIVFLVIVASLL
ncbi:MAG: hypothetical protein Q8M29_17105 [Bacteroidota bacterium]|nr:hypothetical protein [Bacteroidota bacterium]